MGTLQLYVSNQSFDDDTVNIAVTIDGTTVVDEEFHVGNQHIWVNFPLVLRAGDRSVRARADTGVVLDETVTVPDGGTYYAVLQYWDEGEQRQFSWNESAEPVGFA